MSSTKTPLNEVHDLKELKEVIQNIHQRANQKPELIKLEDGTLLIRAKAGALNVTVARVLPNGEIRLCKSMVGLTIQLEN